MALGRVTKMDIRRQAQSSSSYCSTLIIVLFVALCLIGVWMVTSSAIGPVEIVTSGRKSESKKQAPPEEFGALFDDSAENGADDSTNPKKAVNNENISIDESIADTVSDLNMVDKSSKKPVEKTQSDSQPKENRRSKGKSKENLTAFDDGNDMIKDEDKNSIDNDDDQRKNSEEASVQTDDSIQHLSGNAKKSDKMDGDTGPFKRNQGMVEEVAQSSKGKEDFPDGAQSELLKETTTQDGTFSTQDAESKNEKKVQEISTLDGETRSNWKLCSSPAGPDFIPCLDNEKAIKKLRSTKHYEHRERHCPEDPPTCLVPLPEGYKRPIEWPNSRDKIWYTNVPHSRLAEVKGHQNWVKVSGEYLTFPGGGTQFKHGALHYINFIEQSWSDIAWGRLSRVVLDVGCGVASFGGFLFERDALTMSFAPKDEHEAQVQFALERGIPAISAVMGTQRLPYPSRVFDTIHCARCRVPWHIEGGKLLLELNRLLRPGGYFVWSATPVYQKLPEDVEIWDAMSKLTKAMCWKMVNKTKDTLNQVGMAIYRKPKDNKCYEQRKENNPPLCPDSDDADAAWNVPLQACMHKLPSDPTVRGSYWPEEWPQRVETVPYWLSNSNTGVYGKPAREDFGADYEHWKNIVSKSYVKGMGIDWSRIRNVMDMKSVYGGFAAALKDMKVWVMNIVPIDSPDTLPLIYERGLFGMYHDWCESFSTYPRSYDLLHADHLFSKLKKRCKLRPAIAEVDRILRPEGKLIVRDDSETIAEVESLAKSLNWEVRMTYSKHKEGLLCVEKTIWRPKEVEAAA